VNKNRPFILGVAGKPASGKTEVLNILAKEGWCTVNCDEVVHALYEAGGDGQRKIVDFFGEEFLRKDGSVNRKKLRKIVFKDVKKLKILNALIHPLVLSEVGKRIDKCDGEKMAVEAIYFDDKFLGNLVDGILSVERGTADIEKVLIGRGLTMDMAQGVLDAYVEPVKKDFLLKNNSTLKELAKKVIMTLDKFKF
jgi:dephospho-CoA kinase